MDLRIQTHARPRASLLVAVGVLALLVATVALGQTHAAAAEKPRPSFVVIQTDDQTLEQLYATYTPREGVPIVAMPNTLRLIADRGITFNRYYVPYPLCCPSRVSLLTGRYAHNHNVRGNVPPEGGYTGFSFRGAMTHNIATWLQPAGANVGRSQPVSSAAAISSCPVCSESFAQAGSSSGMCFARAAPAVRSEGRAPRPSRR